jgi:hypothetical protein
MPIGTDTRFQTETPTNSNAAVAIDDYVVVCPCCHCATDSLKSIKVRNVIYLGVIIFWYSETLIGCSKCARSMVLSRIMQAIPASNILFPLSGFLMLLKWVEAGASGHTDSAIAVAHRMKRSDYLELAQIERPTKHTNWFVVALLVLFIGGLAFAIYRGLQR